MKTPAASCRLLKRLESLAVFASKVPALVLLLVMLSALLAAAQTSHVLIVEDLEKSRKPKYYYEGDYIIIHLSNSRQLHKGRIIDLTDSTLQIKRKVFMLKDIDYIKVNDVGKLAEIGTGFTLAAGFVVLVASLNQKVTIPAFVFIPIGVGVGAALISHNQPENTRNLGPETGWRLRMKKIAQPAVAAETTNQNQ